MKLYIERNGPALIARVEGELDMAVAEHFREHVEQALNDDEDVHALLFNLAKVSFIDSSGLGVILGRYKRMTQQGGRVVLAQLQPQVERILELSGVLRIVQTFDTEEDALRALGVSA